jgi:hypothetical protein
VEIGCQLKPNLMGIGGLWANIKIVPGRPGTSPEAASAL